MSQAGSLLEGQSPLGSNEFITNSGTAVPIDGVIEILGSGAISTSGSGNTITISISGTGFTWNTITSAGNPTQIVEQNAYITSGVSQCELILPLTANVGDAFIVTGYSSLFKLTQNAGQMIILGIQTTTAGVTGYLNSTSFADHVQVVCVLTNTAFKVVDSIGNLTIV